MRLTRELLGAQFIRGDELDRERARVQVPARVQHDLRDHCVVGDHHRDGAKQRLEVIRQLGAAGVPGVHRDEDVTRPPKRQHRAFELEHELSLRFRARDG
eukprot:29337-Pelagococcus_subviridis.AAC.10